MKIRFLFVICFLSCISGFLPAASAPKIVDHKISFGHFHPQKRHITTVIVHSVFNNAGGDYYDIAAVLKLFARYRVSAHYMIGRDGVIYRLVDERDVAYHAGRSRLPNGKTGVNSCSIGIELLTSFTDAPTPEQLKSLTALVKDIKSRYQISYVLRHSDIAPDRKDDPWNMNWDAFLATLN